MDSVVAFEDVVELFNEFRKCGFGANYNNNKIEIIKQRCESLIAKDYKYSVLDNSNGKYSAGYPPQIFFLEKEIGENVGNSSGDQDGYNMTRLRSMISKANKCRAWKRFPVPVILVDGKNICRSSTLASLPEALSRRGAEYFIQTVYSVAEEDIESNAEDSSRGSSYPWSTDELRKADVELLKHYSASVICDLMVENQKIKFLLPMTSSEKIELDKYESFVLWSLPYPGCEFFKDYRDNEYVADNLVFNWEQNYCDAELFIPSDQLVSKLGVNFREYKTWSLVKLTQNYLRLLLKYLVDETSGILVHCISGWDRTPLFISLLRLSLWADRKVHKSLSAMEILYFTLAYDWFFFGHNLPNRISKGEEIMFFCFHFLKYLTEDEFSTVPKPKEKVPQSTEVQESESSLATQGSDSSLSSNKSQGNHPSILQSRVESASEGCISSDMENVLNISEASSANSSQLYTLSDENLELNGNQPVAASLSRPIASCPVAVPGTRQRTESESSFGSWQIISGMRRTESVRSSISSLSDINENLIAEKVQEVVDAFVDEQSVKCLKRSEKLDYVQTLFHTLCIQVISESHMTTSEMKNFSVLLRYAKKNLDLRTSEKDSEIAF